MDRSDGVLGELGVEVWYSKRIRAEEIVLIQHEQERWYFDWMGSRGDEWPELGQDRCSTDLYLGRTDARCTDCTCTWSWRRASELSRHSRSDVVLIQRGYERWYSNWP